MTMVVAAELVDRKVESRGCLEDFGGTVALVCENLGGSWRAW